MLGPWSAYTTKNHRYLTVLPVADPGAKRRIIQKPGLQKLYTNCRGKMNYLNFNIKIDIKITLQAMDHYY